MKWGIVVLAALLAIPAVFALESAGSQCRSRMDCIRLVPSIRVLCAPGLVPDRDPECRNGQCLFCVPVQYRPTVDCRIDRDCAGKTCVRGLASRCSGSKCICALPRPECKTDRDCMRAAFISRQYQKQVCQRGKCITPPPVVTMLPRYAPVAPTRPPSY